MSEELKKYRVLKAVAIDGIVGIGAIVELTEAAAANIGIGEYLEEVVEAKAEAKPEESQTATASEGSESGDTGESQPQDGNEAKPEGSEKSTTKHIVTQEDLDANPELVEKGVQVGDEIEIPE